ncbi:Shedu anti-phage system protein SduA domain-containing protein [Streptomyces sp. NPDC047042]|uniref:Shedu anti-phage system protein SduA domain-containing protein n=1 Tax=Streptomyces sp. NPDC047042 TaxID=3154807 RepID=UPI0033CC2502
MSSLPNVEAGSNPPSPAPLPWETYAAWLKPEWERFLQSCHNEPDMQDFLERHPCLLPGATDNVGGGGHHGATFFAVIRQPLLKGLGPDRLPDFMWVRRSTGVIHPICIEIENPKKNWFTKGARETPGVPTAELTQALDQLIEWKVWFSKEENQSIFKKMYAPNHTHWRVEPEYVLVYGRDAEFRDGTSRHANPTYMREKRDHMRRSNEHFWTYDRLRPIEEGGIYATLTRHESGWSLNSVPPTFSLDDFYYEDLCSVVKDPSEAISKSELMPDEWKTRLANQWQEIRDRALARRNQSMSNRRNI